MRRLAFTFALASVVAAAAPVNPGSDSLDQYGGEWRQVDYLGVPAWDSGKCAAVRLQERVVTFAPSAGKLPGVQVSTTHARLIRNEGGKCRIENTAGESPFSYMSTRSWELRGTPKGSGLEVQALFDETKGDACPDCFTGQFATELRLAGSTLVDTYGTADLADDMVFQRAAEADAAIEQARAAAKVLLQALDSGDCAAYSAGLSKATQATVTKAAAVEACRAIGAQVGKIDSRTVLERKYVNREPISEAGKWTSRGRPVEMVFFMNQILTAANKRGIEALMLSREDGEWKMLWHFLLG